MSATLSSQLKSEILIVSHGSPSNPESQERFICRIAERVGARTGLNVRGATLAKADSLKNAVDGWHCPIIFPHFMTDGWFVSVQLQNKLRQAGVLHWTTMKPLGLSNELAQLGVRVLKARIGQHKFGCSDITLILAAHGSPSDPRPKEATDRFAQALRATNLFCEVRLGFIDEQPSIEDALCVDGPAILLPFFATRAGHVLVDIQTAIDVTHYTGVVLSPIGTWDHIPKLIANSLREADNESDRSEVQRCNKDVSIDVE